MRLALLLSAFCGRWIGATVGHPSPAHIWEISQASNDALRVASRWEGEPAGTIMDATLIPDAAAFVIGKHRAELLDSQHFVVPGWDTNDRRGYRGPDFDVIFARPGLAELTALEAYATWLQPSAPRCQTETRSRPDRLA